MAYSHETRPYGRYQNQGVNMAQVLQGAHTAGQNNGHFWYAQGNASANILSNGYGVAQAGHGPDQAVAIVPPQQVYVDRPYPVEVPETRSKFKSKRTCLILCLLLGLFIVCGAVAGVVAVHEIHKANDTAV